MATDFDFLYGDWHVAHRRRKQRLGGPDEWEEFDATARCWPLMGGAANIDEITFATGEPAGATLRLFDPERRTWSLYWATSASGQVFPPVVGSFADGVGTFDGDDIDEGRPVRVRFVWSDITPSSARWEQAYSTDEGKTWQPNWSMLFTRR